jgi:hypothetical protein
MSVLNDFRLVFRDLALVNDFIWIDACWAWSGVCWDQKPFCIPGKGDVFGFLDNHSNVAMLSAPILSCDAASGIG